MYIWMHLNRYHGGDIHTYVCACVSTCALISTTHSKSTVSWIQETKFPKKNSKDSFRTSSPATFRYRLHPLPSRGQRATTQHAITGQALLSRQLLAPSQHPATGAYQGIIRDLTGSIGNADNPGEIMYTQANLLATLSFASKTSRSIAWGFDSPFPLSSQRCPYSSYPPPPSRPAREISKAVDS